MDENKMKNLEALKNFIERDMKIKNDLNQLAPSIGDDYDKLSRMEYIDKLEKELKGFEYEFLACIKDFELGDELNDAIKNYFENAKRKIAIGKYEQGICQKVYNSQFASMNEKFVEDVKGKFWGYTFYTPKRLIEVIEQTNTINELLHAIHTYVVNNDKILESLPKIGMKENTIEEPITIYGEENELAQKIFDEFPLEMDCGITDIVSLKNKILMMVRDRGHALTIDMDTSNQKNVEVRYFVPKLCNVEMIKKLPGINQSSITLNGASGFFVSDKDKITKDLFGFIEKVPTDGDIVDDRKNMIFKIKDAKELAMQQGENGRQFSEINEEKNKIVTAIKNLKEKIFDKDR